MLGAIIFALVIGICIWGFFRDFLGNMILLAIIVIFMMMAKGHTNELFDTKPSVPVCCNVFGGIALKSPISIKLEHCVEEARIEARRTGEDVNTVYLRNVNKCVSRQQNH